MFDELEREQTLREAVALLPSRCQEMIRLLFYEAPPLPIFELKDFVEGIEGEKNRRLGVLSLLYHDVGKWSDDDHTTESARMAQQMLDRLDIHGDDRADDRHWA